MNRFYVIALVLGFIGVAVTGCAFLDNLAGLDPSSGDFDSQGSPAEIGGSLLGLVIPWGSAAVSALLGLYANARRGAYLNLASSLANGVQAIKKNADALAARLTSGIADGDGLLELMRAVAADEREKAAR